MIRSWRSTGLDSDRFTKLSSESLVLIDATDPDLDWDGITSSIRAWMLSIGFFEPKYTELVEVTAEDVELLLTKARMLVADSDRYMALSIEQKVTFIPAWGRSPDEVVDSVDRHWHG